MVAAGVAAAGYSIPTPIQTQAIPHVMKGGDVMGLAQTGTGKTAAFALPILNRLIKGKQAHVRCLIIAPTRELTEQIHQTIKTLGRQTHLRSTAVYGGVGINPQIQSLNRTDIVVACPGRLLDHINRRTVDLSQVEVLVLDEADMMFDMGFLPDIHRILKHLPQRRQTLMFSATMPTEIRHLADKILHDPAMVQVGVTAPADTVSHTHFPVAQHLKTALLLKLLGNTNTRSVLVFTRTKHRAKVLGDKLSKAGYRSTSLQGNLSQGRRQAALDGFRDGTYQILVATDIAARGIDITRVSHVINFDIPSTPEAYIHRIGRTGRAERSGDAFTLITDEDKLMVRAINQAIGASVERRILADFDYNAPPTLPLITRQSSKGQPSRADKTPHMQKGRIGKGTFTGVSYKKTDRFPDNDSRPSRPRPAFYRP
jgi:ATP-dependent RNA helicase RhlE